MVQFERLDPKVHRLMLQAKAHLGKWVLSQSDDERFILPDSDTLLLEPVRREGLTFTEDARMWRAYIAALGDYKLGLFGHGWGDVPAVADQAQPPIANGPELRRAIHRSRLVLYLHTWTVHHPRLYDTAAAGGALLAGLMKSIR